MQYRGTVTSEPFAVGSKSEHQAVKLVTDRGTYVLRRQGGNAFRDPTLEKLVGKTIECEGRVSGTTLIITDWREL
jgi:hypothetical protein